MNMPEALPEVELAKPIRFNPDQAAAIESMVDFIQDPDPESLFFILSGYAGTGKTFCMRELVARCAKSKIQFAFTAPTNKAAKELRKVTGSASTIYSLLGLRLDKSGEVKAIVEGKQTTEERLEGIDVIFIDEASMINKSLMTILEDVCFRTYIKVIFMGDPAQLPPVGESASKIWSRPVGAMLTKVERHDNQILDLVTSIRQIITSPIPSINIRDNNKDGEGVFKVSKEKFRSTFLTAAHRGLFADGNNCKVVAWRNVKVDEYNNLIRYAIFGEKAEAGLYIPGDRIVAAAPCLEGDQMVMATDDEGIVEEVQFCKHPTNPKYTGIALKVRTETNRIARLLILHPLSQAEFDKDSQILGFAARQDRYKWPKFWAHRELFHSVKYAYALTVHRSQGSTYTNVWADYQDILCNRNRQEAFQCLYVATSRPTTRLYLA